MRWCVLPFIELLYNFSMHTFYTGKLNSSLGYFCKVLKTIKHQSYNCFFIHSKEERLNYHLIKTSSKNMTFFIETSSKNKPKETRFLFMVCKEDPSLSQNCKFVFEFPSSNLLLIDIIVSIQIYDVTRLIML